MQNRLQVRKIIVWTAALVLAVSAGNAEAARWKRGTRPAGTSYEVRGACYYTTAESGTNECRYKINNGCRWEADSGSNQCTPQSTNLTPGTLTASNGTITITPLEDGDGLRETMYADLSMMYAATGDKLKVRVRLRAPVTNDTVASLMAPTVISRTPTTKVLLPGDSRYPWNVQRVVSATGAPLGWCTQTDQVPVPLQPPPSGYACGVAWQQFANNQFECYTGRAGAAILLPIYDAVEAAYRYNLKCGVGLFTGLIGTVGYFNCIGGAAGIAFTYSVLDHAFNVGGGSTAGGAYKSLACNSITQSRWAVDTYCQRVP